MNPVITYDKNIQQGGVDLSVTPVGNGVAVTYGDYTKQGGTGPLTKKSNVTFNVTYSNVTQVVNSDNSVTVSYDVVISNFVRAVVATDYNLNVQVSASIAGHQFWNFYEAVAAASNHAGYSGHYSVTVPPLGTSWGAGVHFLNNMDNTPIDDEFNVGMRIYNPNHPDYRPGQDRVSGVWESHNRSAGRADIRSGGAWVTMRTQDGGSGTGNPPLIHTGGSWINQRKIGANQ